VLRGIWEAMRLLAHLIALAVLMAGLVFIFVDLTIILELAGVWHHLWILNPPDIVWIAFSIIAVPVSIRFWTRDLFASSGVSAPEPPCETVEPVRNQPVARFALVLVAALVVRRALSGRRAS
jgi:hypothetical protein